MKIRPTQTTQKVAASERDGGRRASGASPAPVGQPAAQVQRSSFAKSLEDVTPGRVRRDLVAEVRAQLADGTFEDSVDMDQVIDSLLADL